MYILDTHAHLDQLDDIDQALDNARTANVRGIVCVSMNKESCKKNLELSLQSTDPKIFLAMGVHPSDASDEQLQGCLDLIRAHSVRLVAIGEIGLDFWYKWVRKDQEKKDEQRRVFKELLDIAVELNLPAIIHTRGTWREALETTMQRGVKRALFHWYSGPLDVLRDIIKNGYYVSTSPSVAYSPQSREAMMHAPIERTMIETDCPVFYRDRDSDDEGFRAEPRDVIKTLEAYCTLKNLDKDEALRQLNQNAEDFFGIAG